MIAQATHRLTGDLFQYENLGAVEVKGFAEPVPAWRVFGESAVENRFEALHPSGGETPLVGRGDRTAAPALAASQERRGSGCTAFGRAGHWQVAHHRCAPEAARGRAAHPIALFLLAAPPGQRTPATIAQLERATGLAREDTPELKLTSWRHCSLRRSHRMRTWRFSPSCCRSRPPPPTVPPASNLTPQRKKEQTFEALLRQLTRCSRGNGRC